MRMTPDRAEFAAKRSDVPNAAVASGTRCGRSSYGPHRERQGDNVRDLIDQRWPPAGWRLGGRVPGALALLALVAALVAPPATASAPGPAPAPAPAPAPVTILPLGDSITYGGEHGSYRAALWARLVERDGAAVDFVGSQNDGPDRLPDADHEGHSGWRVDEIEAEAAGWVRRADPDIVLLHIGTNDLIQGAPPEVVTARLDRLLTTLVATQPGLTVITASLIPLDRSTASRRAYNAGVADLVARHRQQGHDVVLADMSRGGIGGSGDIPDGVHPGAAGYAKMAAVWYPLVRAELDRRA